MALMKVTTWNVNGIRARQSQLLEWIEIEAPDVICLQEIKALPDQVPPSLCDIEGYWCFWHGSPGGYSGVGLHLRKTLAAERPQFFHPPFDLESRIVAVQLGSLIVSSIYVPNGGKDFPAKMRFLEALDAYVQECHARGLELLLCGDMNVALTEKDVHPKLRKPTEIGQTPEEQAMLGRIIGRGLVDLARKFDPDNEALFTWWAPWRNLRERNIGWRLDYLLASEPLSARAETVTTRREFGTSDHAPVTGTFAASGPPEGPVRSPHPAPGE
jgi:exodeoxyribonuclease-3